MQIKISLRSALRKKSSILYRTADYPDTPMTVEDFLAETVRQNLTVGEASLLRQTGRRSGKLSGVNYPCFKEVSFLLPKNERSEEL